MKRIFIISPHSMFSRGVEALLRKESGFEFVGRATCVDRAIESIRDAHPDVVILDYGSSPSDHASDVMRLFRERSGTRIIGLNLQDNRICVYQADESVVREVKDLVNAMQDTSNELKPVPSDDLSNETINPLPSREAARRLGASAEFSSDSIGVIRKHGPEK